MTRAEHLAWAKGRALEYVDDGNLTDAFGSLISDLGKHEDLVAHAGIELSGMLLLGGHLATVKDMRDWIEGFN